MENAESVLGDPELDRLCIAILTQHVEDCDSKSGPAVDRLWERIKELSVERRRLFRAEVETRHFSFEGYGATAEAAAAVCHDGWLSHCTNYRPDQEIDSSYVSVDDIGVYEVEVGKAYRDREKIG